MMTINSIGSATFQNLETVYEQLLSGDDSSTAVVMKFLNDDLTVEFVFDDEAHTFTAISRETGEIRECTDIRLPSKLFSAISEFFSDLYFSWKLA